MDFDQTRPANTADVNEVVMLGGVPVLEQNRASANVPFVGELTSRKKPAGLDRRKFLEQVGSAASDQRG
jgi:hypothetical protein